MKIDPTYRSKIYEAFPDLVVTDVKVNTDGLGESFVQRIMSFYPEIRTMLIRARFMAGAPELEWVLGGLRRKDNSWFLVHIGRARDVLPIDGAGTIQ